MLSTALASHGPRLDAARAGVPLRATASRGGQRVQPSRTFAFPPTGFTLHWWADAWNSEGMWKSLANSAVVGLGATAIALMLGTMAAVAVQRYDFFGRHVVSFLVVLPITLPGIVTGIALNATFTSALGVTLGMATVIIGHATFCIVIVFNNTQARLRRMGTQPGRRLGRPRRVAVADLPLRDVPDDARFPGRGRESWRSRCRSTRSSSRHSRRGRRCRHCRSGYSETCSAPTRPP